MRKLTDSQREKLMAMIRVVYETEQRLWGLLSPSSERDSARLKLKDARHSLENIIHKDAEIESEVDKNEL